MQRKECFQLMIAQSLNGVDTIETIDIIETNNNIEAVDILKKIIQRREP